MRGHLLDGLTIGAPPDPLGPLGQNWMLTGFSPRGLAESGYAPWIATLRAALSRAGGLCSPQDMIERYAANTTRDLTDIDWYAVLACFKLGIILEGTHARAAVGMAPIEVGDYLHAATLRLFERAQRLMEGGR